MAGCQQDGRIFINGNRERGIFIEYHHMAKALNPPSTMATVPVTNREASDMR